MRVWWIECVKCGQVNDKYQVIAEAHIKRLHSCKLFASH